MKKRNNIITFELNYIIKIKEILKIFLHNFFNYFYYYINFEKKSLYFGQNLNNDSFFLSISK